MVLVQYKPYKFLVKNIVLKKGIFINNIEYYAIKYKNNKDYNNWVVQTPLLFIPFDMTRYEGNNNYLDLSFLSQEYDKDIKVLNYDTKSVYGFGHQVYYENVIKVLNDKNLPDTDGNQGLQSLKIILAAYLSAEKDKTISLPVEIQ